MLRVINHLINFLVLQNFILFIGLVLLLIKGYKKKAIVLSIIAPMLIWRVFFSHLSSRYFSLFIIVFILVSVFAYKKVNKVKAYRFLFFSLLTVSIVYNVAKDFSGYRNTYIFDINDVLRLFFSKENKIYTFIEDKDYFRFFQSNQDVTRQKQTSNNTIDVLVKESWNRYSFWKDDGIFLVTEKGKRFDSKIKNIPHGVIIQKIGRFIRNKNKDSFYSMYYQTHFDATFLSEQNHISQLGDKYDSFPEEIKSLICEGILKSYDVKNECYIFQVSNVLFWIIGKKIDKNTEIIYHIYSEPDNYENRGFRVGSKFEIKQCENYRIFRQVIPQDRRISCIKVGLRDSQYLVWFTPFQISETKQYK